MWCVQKVRTNCKGEAQTSYNDHSSSVCQWEDIYCIVGDNFLPIHCSY